MGAAVHAGLGRDDRRLWDPVREQGGAGARQVHTHSGEVLSGVVLRADRVGGQGIQHAEKDGLVRTSGHYYGQGRDNGM